MKYFNDDKKMLILKHVEYEIPNKEQLQMLIEHLDKTISQMDGIQFKDIRFLKNKKEFVVFLESKNEETYHKWRITCPPPPGAKDWYEVLLTGEDHFLKSMR